MSKLFCGHKRFKWMDNTLGWDENNKHVRHTRHTHTHKTRHTDVKNANIETTHSCTSSGANVYECVCESVWKVYAICGSKQLVIHIYQSTNDMCANKQTKRTDGWLCLRFFVFFLNISIQISRRKWTAIRCCKFNCVHDLFVRFVCWLLLLLFSHSRALDYFFTFNLFTLTNWVKWTRKTKHDFLFFILLLLCLFLFLFILRLWILMRRALHTMYLCSPNSCHRRTKRFVKIATVF